MSRRALPAFLILLAAALCPAQKIDLTVWGQGVGADDKGIQDAVREFERRHPNVRVKLLEMGAGDMNRQKLMTAIVGNVPPDVIHQDRFTVADWASQNAFQPLDDLIARDRHTDPLCPTKDEFFEAAWEEASFGGRQYAIPTAVDTRALYWNRAIFRENAEELRAAGLDPTRAPRTWSELLAYSRVLTEFNEDGTLKRAGFIPNFGNSWLYIYSFMNNGAFLSPDGRTATMAAKENVVALQYMVDGYEVLGGYDNAQKFRAGFQGEQNDPFMAGQIAMKIDGDWIIYGISRYKPGLDFGVAYPPVPDDRYHQSGRFADEEQKWVTWAGGFCYAIPRGAEHREAAWEFIKFMTSVEGWRIQIEGQRELDRGRGRVFIPHLLANRMANQMVLKEYLPGQESFRHALVTHAELMDHMEVRPATFVGQALWDEHNRATEAACLGIMSPEQALTRADDRMQRMLDEYFSRDRYPVVDLRAAGIIGLAGAGLTLALLLVWARRWRAPKLARHEARWAYVFISPWLTGFVALILGPMLASGFFAFTQWNVLGEMRWVGGRNFESLFLHDSEKLVKAFYNVLYLSGIGVPLSLVTGLAVALLLNSGVRGMRWYRTVYYLPAVVPTVAATVLWIWILNADPSRGLLNYAWGATISEWFNSPPPGWLSVEAWAKPSIILMGLWGAGAGMILWLAGLKGVPNSLYEAAGIDGASPWQQFWTVTLPMLSPIIFFNAVMGFIAALQQFDSVYVITKGENAGVNDSLLMPVYYLFLNAFYYFRMGYASAIAWLIFVIIIAVTAVQFLLAPRWVHYEADK